MVLYLYNKAFNMLMKKPIKLWGLSLLYVLLCALAGIFGILPIVFLPITFVLEFGMVMIFLAAVRDEPYNEEQLFLGFKDFWRVCGAIGWRYLWILIWGLIPIAGPVFAIIKGYSYRFVPYILLENPSCSATEALRISKEKTQGHKGQMFGCDILVMLAFWVVGGILMLLAEIPFIGKLFAIVYGIIAILFGLLITLFNGLVQAAMWCEVENPTYVKPVKVVPPAYPQYPQQPGYPQYPQQPAYPQQPGYPQQDGYQPQPGYQGYNAYQAPAYPPYGYAPEQQPEAAPTPELVMPEVPKTPAPEVETPVVPSEPVPEAPEAPAEAFKPEQEPAAPAPAFCPNCGAPIAPGAMFCGGCGQSLK